MSKPPRVPRAARTGSAAAGTWATSSLTSSAHKMVRLDLPLLRSNFRCTGEADDGSVLTGWFERLARTWPEAATVETHNLDSYQRGSQGYLSEYPGCSLKGGSQGQDKSHFALDVYATAPLPGPIASRPQPSSHP